MTANINSMVLLGLSWVNKIRHPCQYASQQLNQTCSTTAWIPTLQNYCFFVLFYHVFAAKTEEAARPRHSLI